MAHFPLDRFIGIQFHRRSFEPNGQSILKMLGKEICVHKHGYGLVIRKKPRCPCPAKQCCVMWKTARLQVLLVLPCNKWWTLWILFIIVPFIYYLQQATVILTEVVCCKSKAVMSRAGWDMLVSRDHLCAVLLICLSWAGICNWWAGQLHWGIYTQGSLTTPYL